ncbi:MAG: class I SAM-dependent methyltransferase [Steroidobacteraceae bacterium]|jgi:SAM-dependent methyltransferase
MTGRGVPAPSHYRPLAYWEDRAQRFAGDRDGLAAVCSYGMPEFYNRVIDWEQRLALAPWLRVRRSTRVLDVGCGVGRWSRLLAGRGAAVLGVDLSPTMIAEARRRAAAEDLACRFAEADASRLQLGEQFDLVLGVTVLQHILDTTLLQSALAAMAAHLAPGGRMVLLEAAPVRGVEKCNSSVFVARPREQYLELMRSCGLEIRAITGVDPAPFRRDLLPHLHKLPRAASFGSLLLASAASLPINALFGRRAVERSWHAVFVLQHPETR